MLDIINFYRIENNQSVKIKLKEVKKGDRIVAETNKGTEFYTASTDADTIAGIIPAAYNNIWIVRTDSEDLYEGELAES